MRRRLKRFFKTPKGMLTLILGVHWILLAAPAEGSRAVAVRLARIGGRRNRGGCRHPSAANWRLAISQRRDPECRHRRHGAPITQEPWYVDAVTSVAAILSKYPGFSVRGANVFNPAALAMVAAYYLFHASESWWGAQTGDSGFPKLILVAAGVFIANRVNRMPLSPGTSWGLTSCSSP